MPIRKSEARTKCSAGSRSFEFSLLARDQRFRGSGVHVVGKDEAMTMNVKDGSSGKLEGKECDLWVS